MFVNHILKSIKIKNFKMDENFDKLFEHGNFLKRLEISNFTNLSFKNTFSVNLKTLILENATITEELPNIFSSLVELRLGTYNFLFPKDLTFQREILL